MNRNYFLSYKDNSWQLQYAWFEDEQEMVCFIDNNDIEVMECYRIIEAEDLTEEYNK